MCCRFVQLSDIHFGQERAGERVFYKDVREHLLLDANALATKRGRANLVLIVGDTAFAGKKSDYEKAGAWLDKLTEAVGCDQTGVRLVPGNHDCDRTQLNRLSKNIHKVIRDGTAKSAYADLEELSTGNEEANPLLPKLRAYRDFALEYDSDFQSIGRPVWEKDLPLAEGVRLRNRGHEQRPGLRL